MSIHLQPPVPLVTLVKTEPPKVIKNEPLEEALEEEISTDIKDIDIVYHRLSEDLIKSETVLEDILKNKHLESVQSQSLVVKTENSQFIKTENITEKNKSEDTSDGNVSRGTGQGVVVQASYEHYNPLSNLEIDEQSVLSKDLNSISVRSRKSKSPKKTDFAKCYKTDDTTLWKKEKEKIKVIKAPVIPVEAHEYTSLANDKHVCNHCQCACNILNNLKRHIKQMHRKAITMYQCSYCPYKSKWKHYIINQHFIQMHKDTKDIQWFQCHLCENKFKLKCDLTRHKKFHLTHERMQDGLDLKRFPNNLEDHCSTIHFVSRTKSVPENSSKSWIFQCTYCPTKFTEERLLKGHLQLHSSTKGIECPICTYRHNKTEILKHVSLHGANGEDPFICPICDLKKRTKENMDDHLKVVHSKAIYQKHDSVCKNKTCNGFCQIIIGGNVGAE